jgi:hypothetical protein
MSFTQDLFTSRRNYSDGSTRLGQLDRIWYDKGTHTLRISDGSTPGGLIILGGGGGSGIILVKDEGIILTAAASSLNFLGAGVTATVGNPLTGDVDVTIPGGIAGVSVSDEGSVIAATANSMNFVGAGVTATAAGNVVTVTIPAAAAASNTIAVQDEGSTVSTAASTLNFVGTGVTAASNGTVTVPGIEIRDEGSVLTTHPKMIDFVGAGVTTTVSITNDVTVTIPAASNTIVVQDEGLALSLPVTAINFIGDTVSAVYNNGVADVTVTGPVQQLGTWTPQLKTNTGTGVFTYAKQEGRYVKTGRHVTCYFTIQVSAHTITTPSSIQLIGLPFTSWNTTVVNEHIGNLVLDYFEFGLTPTHVSGKVLGGTAKVDLYWHGLSAGPTATIALLNDTNLTFPDQDYVMIGTITYITEDPTPPPDEEDPR